MPKIHDEQNTKTLNESRISNSAVESHIEAWGKRKNQY